jgi:hypothetical protein
MSEDSHNDFMVTKANLIALGFCTENESGDICLTPTGLGRIANIIGQLDRDTTILLGLYFRFVFYKMGLEK